MMGRKKKWRRRYYVDVFMGDGWMKGERENGKNGRVRGEERLMIMVVVINRWGMPWLWLL